jgi:hypothetical protein
MGMNVVLRIQCDGCDSDDATYIDLYEDSGGCYREGDLFEQARAVDGWYYADTGVYVCNDCLHLGPWLCGLDKEQIESGNISDDELVEVIDGYPDPDDEDFPNYFCIPENLDLSDEMIQTIASKIKGCIQLPCLTELSDAGAESLSKVEGDLDLDGLLDLSDAAAESLSKHKGILWLNGLTQLADAAAESLSNHEGELFLNGLTELSDIAADIFAKKKSDIRSLEINLDNLPASAVQILRDVEDPDTVQCLRDPQPDLMKEIAECHTSTRLPEHIRLRIHLLTELSDLVAERLSKLDGDLRLDGLTDISDAAAENLRQNRGNLNLNGLTSLSDAAAESLGKHDGDLRLDGLTDISDAAAENLRQNRGNLNLNGLTSLSDAAAESLGKHDGELYLCGLRILSDVAAERLVNKIPQIRMHQITLTNLPDSAAQVFRDARHDLTKKIAEQFLADNKSVDLRQYKSIDDTAAKSLCNHRSLVGLNGLTELSDAAAKSLGKHEGDLYLNGLTKLSDSAARGLAHKQPKFENWAITLDQLPASAAQILRDAGHGV